MQRHWRNKPTEELIKLMEESVDMKLYLIQERGPLSMTFQDEQKKKFNINIGETISCSCGGGKTEHCVHTLFALNRVFKIAFNNPLVLQLKYSDSELNKIVEMKNKKKKMLQDGIMPCAKKQNEDKNRMSLLDDVSCVICQEDMYTSDGLFYCANSCGHNFHIHCLKIWAEHKKEVSDLISCPMCRSEWDENLLQKLFISQPKLPVKQAAKIHKGVNCNSCPRGNIKYERFHCLMCASFDLCIECYLLAVHPSDHFLLIRLSADDKWNGVEYNQNYLTSDAKYLVRNIKLNQFLVSCLQSYKTDNNSQEDRKADSDDTLPAEQSSHLKCIVCNSNSKSSSLSLLKLLVIPNCKHLVHFKCAESLFKVSNESKTGTLIVDIVFNKCRGHNAYIFPGLNSINCKVADPQTITEQQKCQSGVPIAGRSNANSINMKINTHGKMNIISPGFTRLKSRGEMSSAALELALNIQKVTFNEEFNIRGYEKQESDMFSKRPQHQISKPANSMNFNHYLKPKVKKIAPIKRKKKEDMEVLSISPALEIQQFDFPTRENRPSRVIDVKNVQFKVYLIQY